MEVNDWNENYIIGWALIYRSILKHDLIGFKKPFKKSEAWIWMLLEAKFEGKKETIDFGGKERIIFTPRGSFTHSFRFMAKKFGWSKNKVINFINCLENEKMLAQKQIQQITQISICNYDRYQNPPKRKKDSRGTAEGQQRDRTKELKELKESFTHDLQFYIFEHYPTISKMKNFITEKECIFIKEKYSEEEIIKELEAMENWKPLLIKNQYVGKTLLNWLRRKYGN